MAMTIKNFKSNKKLIIISCCVLLAVIISAAVYFATTPDRGALPASTAPAANSAETTEELPEFYYSADDIKKIAEDAAKAQYGEDAFVICLSPDGPTPIDIHGTQRYVYIYGADSLSAQAQSGNIRGLYHIDPDSGEIFDNGNGKMEKLTLGE